MLQGLDRNGKTVVVAHNLPRQTTSFIGRQREIADIIALLDRSDCQLLTLLGPGGIGKTRLAIEVARQVHSTFADGVYYVALQPLYTADQIPHAIINVLGLTIRSTENAHQQLLWYLGNKHLLLLLDNFEHLLDGAVLLSDIVAAAPLAKLLVTSRETLNLREEWLWDVRGLDYPAQITADTPESYSAIRLFAERARQVRPDFTPAESWAAIGRICQLTEGMPLALELAAYWTKSLSCDAIAAAIQASIDFLASRTSNIAERHRSIRAVFNHSWQLLRGEEQTGFARLTIFPGSFTHQAAEQVCGVSLAVLASLVDKSFVRLNAQGRYEIHSLLRQYGGEHLAASGMAEALNDCHAACFADLLAHLEPALKGDQQLAALNAIEADFDNVRAAWTHATVQRDSALLDAMIDSLWLYCSWRGRFVEGQALFDLARNALAPGAGETPQPVWGRLLWRFRATAMAPVETALAIARAHGQDVEIAYCLRERGSLHCQQRDFHASLSDLNDSLAIYHRLNDRFGEALTTANLVHVYLTMGDWASGLGQIARGAQLAEEIGSLTLKQTFLHYAGWVACFDGDYARAEALLRQAEDTGNAVGFRFLAADNHGSLGYLAFLRGDLEQARKRVISDLDVVTPIRAQGEQGFATIVMAHIACVEEDYQHAHQLAEDALALVRPHAVRERLIARVMAMIACGLGQYDQARQLIRDVLTQETRPGMRLMALPVVALIQAHQGQAIRAAELLGLLFTHPASAKGWLEHWPLIARLRQQLEAQLGAEALAAARERGARLDLDMAVEQALLEMDSPAKQPLVEPLTGRELEVLRLVAEGLSNRDIARALNVVEGTARTHVYNICQKLGARNRTQAVALARTLRLL